MSTRRRRPGAFTLIELIMVITLMVILAATVGPELVAPGARRLAAATHGVVVHLKLARDLAMARERSTWVAFSTVDDGYDVYIEDPDNPGKAHRVYVAHPETGGNFQVRFDGGDFDEVEVQSASFGSTSEVEFDWLGRPHDGNGDLLTSDGTVVLASGGATRTVRVVAQTGMVKED